MNYTPAQARSAKFERRGKVIIDLTAKADDPARATAYKSINAAKRKSREIQISKDGALGLGSVRKG